MHIFWRHKVSQGNACTVYRRLKIVAFGKTFAVQKSLARRFVLIHRRTNSNRVLYIQWPVFVFPCTLSSLPLFSSLSPIRHGFNCPWKRCNCRRVSSYAHQVRVDQWSTGPSPSFSNFSRINRIPGLSHSLSLLLKWVNVNFTLSCTQKGQTQRIRNWLPQQLVWLWQRHLRLLSVSSYQFSISSKMCILLRKILSVSICNTDSVLGRL